MLHGYRGGYMALLTFLCMRVSCLWDIQNQHVFLSISTVMTSNLWWSGTAQIFINVESKLSCFIKETRCVPTFPDFLVQS